MLAPYGSWPQAELDAWKPAARARVQQRGQALRDIREPERRSGRGRLVDEQDILERFHMPA